MTNTPLISARSCLALLFFSMGAAACTDETIAFGEPTGSAGGFVGYLSVGSKQTVCGACHQSEQAAWAATAHATAWATLDSSANAASSCEGCHSVTERGNAAVEPAGHSIAPDDSYRDVQCESCHGSGGAHFFSPAASQPLASIAAGPDLTNGCGECHGTDESPFVDEWAESSHSTLAANSAGVTGCEDCHEGNRALQVLFGETSHYLEKANAPTPVSISCAVCHDPHGSSHESELRASVTGESSDHLCVQCHNGDAVPQSSATPHAAQGPVVLGETVGWLPPGVSIQMRPHPFHGSVSRNPRLCVTCHMATFVESQPAFESKGHRFDAVSCLDSSGQPESGPCADRERDFRACTGSGCHPSEVVARSRYQSIKGDLNDLLDQIWVDTDGDGQIDASDGGLMPQVVALGDASQFDTADGLVTTAEGVLWNTQLAYTSDRSWFGDFTVFGVRFSAQRSSGNGVHNPDLLEDLLDASIDALSDHYGLAPPAAVYPVETRPGGAR